MTTPTSDPATLFADLQFDLGTVPLDIPLGSGTPPPLSVGVVLDTDCFTVTYTERQTKRLMNAVVLVCNLKYVPSFPPNTDVAAPRITDYWVAIQPWRPGGAGVQPDGADGNAAAAFTPVSAQAPNAAGNGVLNPDPVLLVDASPQTTESGHQFSTGSSSTFSDSVGFFGDSPTASLSASTSVSWGESETLQDIRIMNLSTKTMALIHYQVGLDQPPMAPEDAVPMPVSVSQAVFQPQVSAFFTYPDDGQTTFGRQREPGGKDPALYLFNVYLVARAAHYSQVGGFLPIYQLNYDFGFASHVLEVQQPPLPPPPVPPS